ncbi:MAG: chain length determinant protein EpsF [Rhodoferax sp.]|nr:chain length determinant protein EpsF [Rhodoferax sp.]
MSPQQFLRILQARYQLALLIFALTVVTVVWVSLALPKQYTATVALVLDVKSPDPVSGLMLQGMMAPGYMSTQIDIINSDRVAKSVVSLLRLDENPAMRQQWQANTQGTGSLGDWLATVLAQKLDVKPARDSNVININYSASDPAFAAAVANAFAQAYMDVNLDLRAAPARQYASFFDEQSRAARQKLENAQEVMSTYQKVHGITTADERLDYETARLAETSSQLTQVQGQTTDSQSKRANGRNDTLPEVMQSTLINGIKAEIARLQARLADNNTTLGPQHPQTRRAESELAALKAQLRTETQKISSAIETTYQVGKQRERQLRETLEAQKERVLQLNKQRDVLNVMRRDIEAAQRTFELVSQRASQATIESRASQTNISVLNPAVAPQHASKPRLLLNTLVAIILGLLLAITGALLVELTHRRIRSVEDLQEALDVPNLGAIRSTTMRSAAIRFGHARQKALT